MDAPLKAATKYLQQSIKNLPKWREESLAPYERDEIEAIQTDIDSCLTSKSNDDFLICIAQLRQDWAALAALDDHLTVENLI